MKQKNKNLVAVVLIVIFGFQLAVCTQLPLCFELETKTQQRESIKMQAKEYIEDLPFFSNISFSISFNPPKLVELYRLKVYQLINTGFAKFRTSGFNHSPPFLA